MNPPSFARVLAALACLIACATTAAEGPHASPYAGQEQRAIKALSAAEIEALLAGEGMGLAKAAELNGYPGPAHVLELAAALELSPEQLDATRAIEAAMRSEAKTLGQARVEAEAELEQWFRRGSGDEAEMVELLRRIGRIQADLRAAHLKAHLAQRAVLSPTQLARYPELRGYGGHHHDAHHDPAHGHSGGHAH